MNQQSVTSDLLFSIVSETDTNELTVFERLFIAENAGIAPHEGWLADLYVRCGCLEKALQCYKARNHARKLGDLSWARGDLDSACEYYLAPGDPTGHPFRHDKDWDRLIKLSFFRSDWSAVIRFLTEAAIRPSPLGKTRVILGNSESAGMPYVKMLAVALCKTDTPICEDLRDLITRVFQLRHEEWDALSSVSAATDDAQLRRLQKQSLPLPARRPMISLSEACERGNTPRAKSLLSFLREAEGHVTRARKDLRAFLANGDEQLLGEFLSTVLLPGVASIGHSILFRCLEMGAGNLPTATPDRLMRLYGSHPIMHQRYFGCLLAMKFEMPSPVCADDILTGIFQRISSIALEIKSIQRTEKATALDFSKLASCRDWALLRLEQWLTEGGTHELEKVADIWRNRTFAQVRGPFDRSKRDPESPRDMAEWAKLIDDAFEWLGERWKEEIGISPWVSENKLFQLMREAFKPSQVVQHAQPLWLAPQHLDVFVPELSLAVEYMGRQHYEPVEYFGGEDGLRRTRDRDQRKHRLCDASGIDLVYVRHDEDMEGRVRQIRAMYSCRRLGQSNHAQAGKNQPS